MQASAPTLLPPSGFWRTLSKPCSQSPLLLPAVHPLAAWSAGKKRGKRQQWVGGRVLSSTRGGKANLEKSVPLDFWSSTTAGRVVLHHDGWRWESQVAAPLAVPSCFTFAHAATAGLHFSAYGLWNIGSPWNIMQGTKLLEIGLSLIHPFRKKKKKKFLCMQVQRDWEKKMLNACLLLKRH